MNFILRSFVKYCVLFDFPYWISSMLDEIQYVVQLAEEAYNTCSEIYVVAVSLQYFYRIIQCRKSTE